jgi:hypothetical protein
MDAATLGAKVLNLISLHGGYLAQEEVGKAFNITFKPWSVYGDAGYQVTGSSSWYENIGYSHFVKPYVVNGQVLNEGGESSRLTIAWGYFPDKTSLCLRPLDMRMKLIAMGWKDAVMPSREPPPGVRVEFETHDRLVLGHPHSKSYVIFSYNGNDATDTRVDASRSCINSIYLEGWN